MHIMIIIMCMDASRHSTTCMPTAICHYTMAMWKTFIIPTGDVELSVKASEL